MNAYEMWQATEAKREHAERDRDAWKRRAEEAVMLLRSWKKSDESVHDLYVPSNATNDFLRRYDEETKQ